MVKGTGAGSPSGIDHPIESNPQFPTTSLILHCGCAARAQERLPCGPRHRLSRPDLEAFLKSLWLLGVWHQGRLAYWRLFVSALLTRPRQFPKAMELAIMGYHFRRVASDL